MEKANETECKTELIELIYQFLSNQIATDGQLSEAAKESLTVAVECIEQSYKIHKKSPSNELLDIYKSSKRNGTPSEQSADNPMNLLRNLANNILSQTSTEPMNPSASTTSQTSSAPDPVKPEATRVRKEVDRDQKLKADQLKNMGNDMMKEDKYSEAHEYYTQAINIDNNNAIYYSNRAAASSKLGNHQAALDDCKEAIEIDPTYSKAYGRLGLAYASLNDHKQARAAYLKAIELDPHNESYKNNIKIAEEKLEANPTPDLGGIASELAGLAGGHENMSNMLRSVMGNPELVQMAMRTMRDPRMQNLFSNLSSAAGGRGSESGSGSQPGAT